MFSPNTRYLPRLKKSILNNKCFAPISKDLTRLKKVKWQNFVRMHKKNSRQLVRNDLFLVESKTYDLQKGYKNELFCKQKFFAFFNTLKKKPFRRILKRFKNLQSTLFFIDLVLNYVELRLDVILFRANFVLTILQARSLIHRGVVFVNGCIITSASYHLKLGDLVEVLLEKNNIVFNEHTFNLSPSYLEVSYETFSIVLLDKPKKKDLPKVLPYFFNLNELKFSFSK